MASSTDKSCLPTVREAASILSEKKGFDIVIYDVRGVSNVTDFFLITSAFNRRHIHAMSDEVLRFLKEKGVTLLGREGLDEGQWGLIDCGEFVIHIFQEETRSFYDLDLIWGDVEKIEIE